ncbi:hypothetical protein BDW22DRAFT_433999 [Trametopsis cervina]|nr:hypothetical protein BDW22DRAFT_433999 [Trametopsis cervina]
MFLCFLFSQVAVLHSNIDTPPNKAHLTKDFDVVVDDRSPTLSVAPGYIFTALYPYCVQRTFSSLRTTVLAAQVSVHSPSLKIPNQVGCRHSDAPHTSHRTLKM